MKIIFQKPFKMQNAISILNTYLKWNYFKYYQLFIFHEYEG